MKQRISVFCLVIVLLASLFTSTVSAQGGLPACGEDEFAAAAEAFVDGFATYQEIAVLPDEPTLSDLSMLVAVMDGFSVGYWEGFSELAGTDLCAEVFSLGYTSGLVFDETLIVAALSSLAGYEAEAGNDELANSLLELATDRQATLETGLESYGEVMTAVADGSYDLTAELPACTEEEIGATAEGLGEIFVAYEELGTMTADATGSDLSTLITAYATLSQSYWNDFFPVVPSCYEANDLAYNSGLILDDSLTIVALLRLAEFESEAGNDELAVALAESASTRATVLEEDIEAYFADYMTEE